MAATVGHWPRQPASPRHKSWPDYEPSSIAMANNDNINKPDILPTPADGSNNSSIGELNSTGILINPTVDNISSSQAGDHNSTSVSSGNKTGSPKSAVSVVNDQGIVNLSNVSLSHIERQLLIRGLSFCPSPGECSLSNAKIAIDKLHRSLHLAHFFSENDAFSESNEDEDFSHRKFRPQSTWTPPGNPPPTLASFITANNAALSGLPSLKPDFHNLNAQECTALKNLGSNRHITIKPANKGSGVVSLNINDYIREVFRQLSDISFYQALDTDLTSKIS